jgi:hypothetical protein
MAGRRAVRNSMPMCDPRRMPSGMPRKIDHTKPSREVSSVQDNEVLNAYRNNTCRATSATIPEMATTIVHAASTSSDAMASARGRNGPEPAMGRNATRSWCMAGAPDGQQCQPPAFFTSAST